MDRLGPSYVKLGQFLATRPDIVGPRSRASWSGCRIASRRCRARRAVRHIEAAFQAELDTLFSEFGEPVAAASIAQVHQARSRRDGERVVAVKVLRPGVERRFARDLDDMFFAARLAERLFPETAAAAPVQVVETLARSVRMEMDFRLEAAAAAEYRREPQGRGRLSRAARSTGTAPRAKC